MTGIRLKEYSKKLAVLLIFALSINNFAAVVSDNDGSAFVTKAEFESLKEYFATQIDSYNNSIDSKVDGAIASYLAGINMSGKEELINYTAKIKENNLDSLYFYQYPATATPWGVTSDSWYGKWSLWAGVVQVYQYTGSYWQWRVGGRSSYDGPNVWYENGTRNAFFFISTDSNIKDKNGLNGYAIYLSDKYIHSNQINWKIYAAECVENANTFPTDVTTWEAALEKSPTWVYPNYMTSGGVFQNMAQLDVQWSYKVLNLTGGVSDEYTTYGDEVDNSPVGKMSSNKIPDTSVWCLSHVNRSLYDGEQITIYNPSCSGSGVSDPGMMLRYYKKASGNTGWTTIIERNTGGGTFKPTYKIYNHKFYNISLDKFTNNVASNALGSPVYMYNGLPLTTIEQAGTITMKCKFHNIDNPSNKVKIYVLDKKFDNESSKDEDKYTEAGTEFDHVLHHAAYDTEQSIEITLDMTNYANKQRTLWYRLADNNGLPGRVYMEVEQITEVIES